MYVRNDKTPCELLGYQKGDIFECYDPELMLLKLTYDDGTAVPKFKILSGKEVGETFYAELDTVKKVDYFVPEVGDTVIFNKRGYEEDFPRNMPSGNIEVEVLNIIPPEKEHQSFVVAFIFKGWRDLPHLAPYMGTVSLDFDNLLRPQVKTRSKIYHFRTKNKTRGGFTMLFEDGKIGVARCSLDDVFSRKRGVEEARKNLKKINNYLVGPIPSKRNIEGLWACSNLTYVQYKQYTRFLKEQDK